MFLYSYLSFFFHLSQRTVWHFSSLTFCTIFLSSGSLSQIKRLNILPSVYDSSHREHSPSMICLQILFKKLAHSSPLTTSLCLTCTSRSCIFPGSSSSIRLFGLFMFSNDMINHPSNNVSPESLSDYFSLVNYIFLLQVKLLISVSTTFQPFLYPGPPRSCPKFYF